MKNLPKSSGTHRQERKSIRAFFGVMNEELFIVRTEREDDYGVDLSLELVFDKNTVTNIRSQIQLKSDSDGKRNQDRTYSYAVSIDNINYLMNQPNSIYVIYIEGEDVLLWDWVSNIVKLSIDKGLDIKSTNQKTISYRFFNVLNEEQLIALHSTMLKNGKLIREFTELTSFTASVPIKATINIDGPKIMTSDESESSIAKSGIWLANQGRFSELRVLEDMLDISLRSKPEIATILAYGKFQSGNYYDALAQVPKGSQLDQLSKDLKDVAIYLYNHLRFILGILSEDEYKKNLYKFEESSPKSILSLQNKLYRKREELYLSDKTMIEQYSKLTNEIKKILDEIKVIASNNYDFLIRIELFEWEIRGMNVLNKFKEQFFKVRGRDSIGHPITISQRRELAKNVIHDYTDWITNYKKMEERGWMSEGMAAFAFISFSQLQIMMIASFRALGIGQDGSESELLVGIKENLKKFIIALEKEGDWTQSLQARLNLAETEIGLGNSGKANTMLKQIIDLTEMYGVSNLRTKAEQLINGYSIFNVKNFDESETSTDKHLIDLSEDQIPMYVRQVAQLMGLPDDRLTNLEIEYFWLKNDAKERRDYCKYLQVLQDLRHSWQLENAYNINPDRKYTCERFGYMSKIPGKNRDQVLSDFKRVYCSQCKYREPNA